MAQDEVNIRPDGRIGDRVGLTDEQSARQRKGLPIYERDRVVAPYEVRKGKWA